MIFYINQIKDDNKNVIGQVQAERYELHTLKDDDFIMDVVTLHNGDEEIGRFLGKFIMIEEIEDTEILANINLITY